MQGRGNSYRSRKKLAAPPCLEEGQLRQDSSMEYATREMCSTPSLSQSGTLSSARSANDDRDTLPAPDSVGVAVRVRPMTTVESADPRIRNCIQCLKDIVVIGGTSSGVSSSSGGTGAGAASGSSAKAAPTIRPQQFRADTVFHAHSSQNDVYTASCRCIVEGLFLGINGSILAYGATGSGKTHTMFGGTTGAAGIVYRAVQDIFDEKARLEEEEGRLVQVKCSFVEIYNEEVFDLLAEYAGASTNNNNISSSGSGGGDGTAKAASSSASPTGPSGSFASTAAAGAGASSTGAPPRSTPKDGGGGGSSSTKQQQQQHTQRVGRTPLQVRHLKAKGHDRLEICGLRHVFPTTVDDFVSAVQLGHTKRFTAATGANAQSSRSHAIITVEVEVSGGDGEHGGGGGVRGTIASIRFCDLAGSERAASTSNSGIRLREGGKINRSLLALGAVVQALVQRKRHPEKSVFVPYRGSKLTRLLADGIGGNCRTQMLFCLSPSTRQYEESLNTMLFAMQAKEIQVAARRNTFNSEQVAKSQVVLIDELRTELAQVKEELAWARAELQDPNRTARRYSTINGEHSLSRCQSVSPGMPAMNLSLGRIDTGTTLDLQLSGTRDHMRSGCGSPDLINAAHFASAEDANNPATPSPTNFRDGSPQCSPGGAAGVGETHTSHGGFTGGSVSIGLDGLHGVESHMLEPSRSMGRQPSFRQTARQSVFTEGSPMFTELALKLKGFTSDKEVLYHQLRDAQEEQREVDIQLREHKWRLAQFLASNAIGGKVRGEPVCGTTTSGGIAVTPVGVAGLRKLITQLEADTKMKDGELQDLTDRHDALDRQIAATREALLSEKQQPSLELLLDNAQLKQNCTEAECLAATYHQECRAARSREGEYAQALAACVGAIHGLLPLVPHTTTAMDDAKLALIYANLPKASTSEMIHVFENALRADATPPLPPPSIAGSPMRRHARHNSGDLLDTSASDLEEHFKELMEVASSVQLHHHRRRSSGHNIGQEEGMTSPTSASGPVLAPHSPRPPLPAANAVPLCTPSPSPELPQAEALTAEKPRRADDGDEVREASGGGGGSSSDATIREHASSSGEPSRASSSSVETQSSLDAPAALVVDANSILDATPLQLFPETLLGVGVELEDLDGGTSPSECTPGTDMQTATPAALPNSANTTPLEDDEKEQPHSATTANVPALADASILGPFPRTTCSPDTDELANREVELPTTLSPPPPPPTPVVVVEASASVPSSAGEGPLSPPLRQSTQPPESRTSVSSELTPMALRPKSYTRSFSTSNLQATPKKKKKKRGEDEGVAAMGRSPLPQRPASASPLPQPRRAGSGLGPSRMGNGTASPFQRQKTATPNRAPTATRTSAARGATAGSPVPRRRPGTSADATAPAPPPPPNLHERRSNLARATAEAFQRLHSDAASSMAQASHVSNSSGLGAPSWDMFTRSRTAPLPNLSNASTPSTSGNGSGNPSSCGISTHPTGVFDEDRSFFSDASDPRSQKEQRSDDSSLASPRRRAGRRVGGATSTRTGAAPSSSSFSSNAAAERRASTPLRSSASPTKPSKAYNVNKWLRNGAAAKVVVPAPTPTAPSRRGMSSNITITTTNTNTNNNGSNAAPAPKTKDQRGGVAAPNRRTRRGASPPPVPPHTSASPPPNTNTATTNKNNAPAPASTMTLDPPNVEMKSSMLVPPVPSFPPTGPLRQKQTNASASKNSGAYMSSTSSRGSRSSAAGTPMSGVGGGLADDCSPLTNPNGSGSLWGTRTDRAFSMISALSNVSAYSFGDENDDLQVSRSTVSEMVSPRP